MSAPARSSVDPTGEDLKRLLAEDSGGPVVMLNLLKFAPGRRASYERYAQAVEPFLSGVGGAVIYAGECSTVLVGPEAHDWDAMLLVRYPSRGAFLEMVANPDYQRVTSLRTEGLSVAVLQATVPWGAPGR